MRCELGHCTSAKCTRFSIIPVVSFSHLHAISSRLQCNCADLPSGCWVPTLPTQYAGYQRKQSTCSRTSKDSRPLFFLSFFLGDDVELHCIDCRLVSGSYVNTQLSSQVIIEFNKSGSFSMRCKRSKLNSLRRSFCLSDSSFGTIFAQTILMFNSSLRIRRTFSLSKLTPSATARTPKLRSFKSHLAIFNVVVGKTLRGRPGRSSFFTLSLPSENCLCYSNTRARDMQSSRQVSVNK